MKKSRVEKLTILKNGGLIWQDLYNHPEFGNKKDSEYFYLIERYKQDCSLCELYLDESFDHKRCPLPYDENNGCKTNAAWYNSENPENTQKYAAKICFAQYKKYISLVGALSESFPMDTSTEIQNLIKEIEILVNGFKFWKYLFKHPEINDKEKVPKKQFSLVKDYFINCALCEMFNISDYKGCTDCPLNIKESGCKYYNGNEKGWWYYKKIDRPYYAMQIVFVHINLIYERVDKLLLLV